MQEWFEIVAQHVEFSRFDQDASVAHGDTVVVLSQEEFTLRQTGWRVAGSAAEGLTWRDGKVVRYQTYADTYAQVAA